MFKASRQLQYNQGIISLSLIFIMPEDGWVTWVSFNSAICAAGWVIEPISLEEGEGEVTISHES